MERRVHYLIEMDSSKAADARLKRACRLFGACPDDVTETGLFKHRAGFVKLSPENAEEFKRILGGGKRTSFRYSSPTGFFDGSIVSMYETPEDEMADRKSKSYLCHVEHQERLIEKQNNGYRPRE